ncbi:MAG: hypothetical protein HKN47_06450 [Pirellulaceae bacterium]|nr:hypothetical protein [Pirellulaceae bacterium]
MTSTPLRRDLQSIPVDGPLRPYRIIVDEISGRFSRVSEHVWQRLVGGDDDPMLWSQARAAGWTRERISQSRSKFSFLAIRIPLGGIDSIARHLAGASAIVFSTQAIMVWSVVIMLAAVIAASRTMELVASLGSLATFLQQSHPVTIASIFVITKACHELGHAVMCRRMGARCGGVGILLLCGMPNPYCDVTNIWQEPSAIKRAAVMLAGIYVELIIAALATFAWVLTSDPSIKLLALNLMIVCSVSTILFNANPLMRYDGYFVLSDLLGSTNLRQESQSAFRSVVTRRVAGRGYDSPKQSDRRSVFLTLYFAASKIYRVVVSIAIASLLIGFAQWFHLRPLAIGLVLFVLLMTSIRTSKQIKDVAIGAGRWQSVAVWRRYFAVSVLLTVIAGVLLLPLPRYRRSHGIVDAADAVSVYLPEESIVQQVSVDFGHAVNAGDAIVRLQSDSHRLKTQQLDGQLRLAKLRKNLSHRSALAAPHRLRSDTVDQWNTLQAAEESVAAQLVAANQRMAKTDIRAAVDGIVIPPQPAIQTNANGSLITLADQLGTLASTRQAWCRISRDGSIHAALVIDARDRAEINVGSIVKISLTGVPGKVFSSRVSSVSEIKKDERLAVHQDAYQVLCQLPPVDDGELLSMLGQECRGVFRLPRRSFASELVTWVGDWIRG